MAHISQLLFKFILYLSLTLLNALSLLNSKKIKLKKKLTTIFLISPKNILKKSIFAPEIWGLSLVGGP